MSKWTSFILLFFTVFFLSCKTTSKNYSSTKKFAKNQLQSDFLFLKKIIEKKHPSLYWFNSKSTIDNSFQQQFELIKDSMSEHDFCWQVVSPFIAQIKCGHTSVIMSKSYEKWSKHKIFPSFPLYLKLWNDTMAVTASLIKNDSIFKRGTIIKSINGMNSTDFQHKMFPYFSKDGDAENLNFIRLSSDFPYYYRNIFGLNKDYKVVYWDSTGSEKSIKIALYSPSKDTINKKKDTSKVKKLTGPKFKKIERFRSFIIDSSMHFATMKLNTFSRGRLRTFFRKSFRTMSRKHISNLILDIRINGGGNVSSSTLLTKYIADHSFKIADSVYSKVNTLSPFTKHFEKKWLNNFQFALISQKKADSYYHLTRYENKHYSIKKKNHYNGNVYVLMSGPTFSASCLFLNVIRNQQNVKLIGEETGGGSYGNNGIMIPDLTLPQSKLRVRIPLYRIIQQNHLAEKGKGIVPDIYVPTNYDAIKKGYDKKMQVAKELIYKSILK